MTTWDSKITTVVSILGGLVDVITRKMKADNVFDKFIDIVNSEWNLAFPELKGEEIDFAHPEI